MSGPGTWPGKIAVQHLGDIRALDRKLTAIRARIAVMADDSKSRLTGLFDVGPVIAGRILAEVGDVRRFPSRDHFATYNGPPRWTCPPAARSATACPVPATGGSTTPFT